MTPQQKLDKIEKLLPEKVSSIFHDCEYCRLIEQIKFIIKHYDDRFVETTEKDKNVYFYSKEEQRRIKNENSKRNS